MDLKALSDSVYGSDNELVNGEIYYQKSLYADGTPFYLGDEWLKGSVKVNGKIHDNLFLKYNIETDQLILKASTKNGTTNAIVLNAPFIDYFYLRDNLFENSTHLENIELKSQYFHKIYEGDFIFLAIYKKTFVNDYNVKTPYGKYSNLTANHYILDSGGLVKISSKKSILAYSEGKEKDIKKYLKSERVKFKKMNDSQWHDLMEYIDNLNASPTQ